PPGVARKILGPEPLIGLSTHAPEELEAAAAEPIDYLSAGPVLPTPTKPGRPGTGPDYVRLAVESSAHPVFVTGGVSPETLPDLLATGATRFVVVRAITLAPDPVAVTRELRQLMS
ncbi:MAG: thiamine phosphate synthase, partial [Acidimicrobiales bacterium]